MESDDFEVFKEKCEEIGGELKEHDENEKMVCVLEDDGVALSEDGEVFPLGN